MVVFPVSPVPSNKSLNTGMLLSMWGEEPELGEEGGDEDSNELLRIRLRIALAPTPFFLLLEFLYGLLVEKAALGESVLLGEEEGD